MAFYITENGQPTNVILTDGGSIEVGENLSVDENGKLNAQAGTEVYVDDELSLESENPVQNKVITKTIEDVEQVTAAALNDLNDKKADRDELAQVAFTGDYNDLENKPAIPEDFVQQQVDWNATSGVTSIANKPNLATVATTGNYFDLETLPVIPPGTMFVEITEDGGNYVSDKTFNEIKEAYLGNAPIVCRYRDVIYPLTSYQGIAFVFGNTFPHDTDYEHTDIVISGTSGVTFVEKETNLVLGVKVNNGDTIRPTDGIVNLNVSEGGTIDNIEVNGIEGTVENKVASVDITGLDVPVGENFVESELTNEELEISAADDTVSDALGKLQKALKDDEAAITRAFLAVENATGFNNNLEYVPEESTTILGNAKSLQDADAILMNNLTLLGSDLSTVKNNQIRFSGGTTKLVKFNEIPQGGAYNISIPYEGNCTNITWRFPVANYVSGQQYWTKEAIIGYLETELLPPLIYTGRIITFEVSSKNWEWWQYVGPMSDGIISHNDWLDNNNWKQLNISYVTQA